MLQLDSTAMTCLQTRESMVLIVCIQGGGPGPILKCYPMFINCFLMPCLICYSRKHESTVDQDEALATELLPSDVEEPTPDSIAAAKLEKDRAQMRAMEKYYL